MNASAALAARYAALFSVAELNRRTAVAKASLQAHIKHNGATPSDKIARAAQAAQQAELETLAAAVVLKS